LYLIILIDLLFVVIIKTMTENLIYPHNLFLSVFEETPVIQAKTIRTWYLSHA
jgi:hypothetical protein